MGGVGSKGVWIVRIAHGLTDCGVCVGTGMSADGTGVRFGVAILRR
jgi:hypothetical protein